jgi:uncharacterized protein (TIGR04141 family)
MSKTRSFSIFLLKDGVEPAKALNDDHALERGWECANLPEGGILYVLNAPERPPWWRGYFGVKRDLNQGSKGALVFVPADGRWFALSFGHVHHTLKDTAYEYDFGLRITLNCVDPDKLKSTDTLQPSGAIRQRTQLPTAADLTVFDIDSDSTILKSLTGKVKEKHKELFRHATGASNLRISSTAEPEKLSDLCTALLALYKDETFKTAFPDIQNISPVRDPVVIEALNAKLVDAFRTNDDALSLSAPEIQDFNSSFGASYAGARASKVFPDIEIADYRAYLTDAGIDPTTIDLDTLRRHHLQITSEDGSFVLGRYMIFQSLLYDTALPGGATYHLREGNWYLVEGKYVAKLAAYLDPRCQDTTLPNFNHADEGAYNEAATKALAGRVCLDKTSMTPKGQKAVEPCDIYEVANGKAVLHHVKISTLSGPLSHLFNQGTNSVNLIRSEPESLNNLKKLIADRAAAAELVAALRPLDEDELKVVFGIVTSKDKAKKSLNLPLFSRISLMRSLKELKRMGIEAEFCFIPDDAPSKAGKPKKRKPRAKKAVAA